MLNNQKIFKTVIIVLFSMLLMFTLAISISHSKENNEINAFEQNKKLGRGININCDERVREKDFQIVKEAGFESVRLVINWSAHCGGTPTYVIDKTWFDRVDWCIVQSLEQRLSIVLDFHYYPLFSFTGNRKSTMTEAESTIRFYSLWEQIAEHYKDYSTDVMFEIMNEPSNYLGPDKFNKLQNLAIKIIRRNNPERTIIAGTECWNSSYTLPCLMLPEEDKNIIVAVHCYLPQDFTHQGANYIIGAENWIGRTWTINDLEEHELLEYFYTAAAWGLKNNRPIYLNEFGAIRYADMESRVRYDNFVAQQAEKMEMSWAYWAFSDGLFGIYNRSEESWVVPIRDALIPPEKKNK